MTEFKQGDEVWVKGVVGKANWITIETYYEEKAISLSELKNVGNIKKAEKVKLPKFVADWLEECKVKKFSVQKFLNRSTSSERGSINKWIYKNYKENLNLLARAWLDGYEVEKEKLFKVKLLSLEEEKAYLNYNVQHKTWEMESKQELGAFKTSFTRKELEDAGFNVFDNPMFEIVEVEDE